MAKLKAGSLVDVEVTNVSEHGVTCRVNGSDVKGFATNEHLIGSDSVTIFV